MDIYITNILGFDVHGVSEKIMNIILVNKYILYVQSSNIFSLEGHTVATESCTTLLFSITTNSANHRGSTEE